MFNRFIATAFIGTAITLCAGLYSAWAGASDVRQGVTTKCSIVVINGDTVISCPKVVR